MTMGLEWHRQGGRRLRDPGPHGHRGATGLVVEEPRPQQTSQVGLTERNKAVHACSPQRPEQSCAEGVRLGALRRRLQAPEPQVLYTLSELS